MPNVINNKSKTSQLIKIEKDNENNELRKCMRSSIKDKHLANKKETVWERLSKVKKIPNSENTLAITRSRNNLATKTSQRLQTIRHLQLWPLQEPQLQIVNCKPLSPKNAYCHNRRSNVTQKILLPNTIVIPEIENQRFISACKPNKSVNEIMTARSLSESKSSSDDYKSAKHQYADTISPCFKPSFHGRVEAIVTTKQKTTESSEDSNDEFQLAPLMRSHPHCDLNSSTLITNKFREVLRQKNKSMTSEDIELVKDVIKVDHRCRNLNEHNPKLFKDILKTQLQDILKHEVAVKKALDKLESSASLQSNQILQVTNQTKELSEIVSHTENVKEPQKLEVDLIFKNVPSLEKEIIILRTLGEKLEATLRSTTCRGTNISPSIISKSIDKKVFLVVENEIHVLAIQHYAEVKVQVIGMVHFVGIVKEFLIAQKTIIELQKEANRPIYIATNPQIADLKRTTFRKLKENPNMLLRHIKAKNDKVAFNVLDQDPVFFNNILFNKVQPLSEQSLAVSKNEEHYVEKLPPAISHLCEGGDSRIWKKTEKEHNFPHKTLNIKEICNDSSIVKSECKKSTDDKIMKPSKSLEPNIRSEQRRRIRRSLTPMPLYKNTNPKNTLLKTILIGFLQMHLFILLIMAFTYPDPKC